MDEDELTQDILDQFDLICTQHRATVSKQAFSVHDSNVKARQHFGNLMPTSLSGSIRASQTRLTRANSLDIQSPKFGMSLLNSGARSPSSTRQDLRPKEISESDRRQFDLKHLSDQLTVLREELYMKSGELANLKEFADRTNATKSDAIHRLENSLAHERETSRRQLSELNTQLAFREADYRMVCTELTRLKEQLSAHEAAPAVPAPTYPGADFSPASQLIAAVSFSPSTGASTVASRQVAFRPALPSPPRALLQAPIDSHLPSPVTPVPSRRVHPTSGGIWKVRNHGLLRSSRDDTATATLKQTTTTSAAPAQPVLPFSIIQDDCFDEPGGGTPRKRRRQATPIKMLSDTSSSTTGPSAPNVDQSYLGNLSVSLCEVGVNTSQQLSEHQPANSESLPILGQGRLPYRLRPVSVERMKAIGGALHLNIQAYYPTQPEVLAGDLLSIAVPDGVGAVKPSEEGQEQQQLPWDAVPGPVHGVSFSTMDKYILAIRRLLLPPSSLRDGGQENSLSTCVRQLSEALPAVLKHVDQRLESAIDVLATHSFCTVNAPAQTTGTIRPSREVVATSDITDGDVPRLSAPTLPPTAVGLPSGEAYFGEDPFAGAPASQFIAPLLTHRRRCGDPPRRAGPKVFASSCPNFSSDEASAQSRGSSDDHPTTSGLSQAGGDASSSSSFSCHAYTVESGLVGLLHLRSISLALQSWYMHLSPVEASPSPSSRDSQTRESEKPEPVDVLVSLGVTVSRLVSRLLRRLALISLRRGVPNYLTNPPSTKPADTALPSSLLATTTQSTNTASSSFFKPSHSCANVTCLSAEGLRLLSTYSMEVLHMATLLASWMPGEQQRMACDFDLVDCFALCTTAWNCPQCQSAGGGAGFDESVSNCCTAYRATRLSLAGAVLRLLRYLTASGAWPSVGHRRPSTAPDDAENLDPKLLPSAQVPPSWTRVDGEQELLRMNYLQVLLNGRILRHDCQLLAILKWTQAIITWGCPHDLSETTSSLPRHSVDLEPGSETCYSQVQRAELLNQLSGFISTLLGCSDVHWSAGCPCKPQVYAVLIELAVKPLQHLLTLAPPPSPVTGEAWGSSQRVEMQHFVSSLAQWTRALMGLLSRHGETCFQGYTDCLPAYFYLVANLARWIQQQQVPRSAGGGGGCSTTVPRPEGIGSNLVEELYDFEAAVGGPSPGGLLSQ